MSWDAETKAKQIDTAIATELANPAATKDAQPTFAKTAYFTEGELIPWKGSWWKVHLNQETGSIELSMLKPTGGSLKRSASEKKWLRGHPKSDRAVAARARESAKLLLQSAALPSAQV